MALHRDPAAEAEMDVGGVLFGVSGARVGKGRSNPGIQQPPEEVEVVGPEVQEHAASRGAATLPGRESIAGQGFAVADEKDGGNQGRRQEVEKPPGNGPTAGTGSTGEEAEDQAVFEGRPEETNADVLDAGTRFEPDPRVLGAQVVEESFLVQIEGLVELIAQREEQVAPVGDVVGQVGLDFPRGVRGVPPGIVERVTRPLNQAPITAVGHGRDDDGVGPVEGLEGGVQPARAGERVGFADEDERRGGGPDAGGPRCIHVHDRIAFDALDPSERLEFRPVDSVESTPVGNDNEFDPVRRSLREQPGYDRAERGVSVGHQDVGELRGALREGTQRMAGNDGGVGGMLRIVRKRQARMTQGSSRRTPLRRKECWYQPSQRPAREEGLQPAQSVWSRQA